MSKKQKDGELSQYGTGERGHWAWRDGKSVKISEPERIKPNLGVITDSMEPIESMATFNREMFDSKSAYRRHLRAHGYRETGGSHNDASQRSETTAEREAREQKNLEITKKAIQDVKYDRIEFTEKQKEQHRREERAWGKDYPKFKRIY